MKKYVWAIGIPVFILAVISFTIRPGVPAQKAPSKPQGAADAEKCYQCHGPIKELRQMGKHANVACASCHSGLDRHLQSYAARPVTEKSWKACGQCHKDQYNSSMKVSYLRPARDEKSLPTGRSPNPLWEKLMMGHPFTREHSAPRSHPWMLVDILLVDRAFGGRFQPREDWRYVNAKPDVSVWDIVVDKYPDIKEQKPILPQTGAGANPVCFQCKSQDQILDWAYMGDPVKGAKWSRTSPVLEFVKDLKHGANCYTCHDPHATKPRIVRDALIEALTAPDGDTLWHKDPKRTGFKVITMGMRGFTRKIAILDKYDSRLLCGQCHVEYACNPGTDPKTGQPITYADRRTNHIPFKDVFALYDHYTNVVPFLDFRHPLTGALLWKGQHPDTEAFYASKHGRAGVSCDDCHLPKVKDKNGKVLYTSHYAVTPKVQLQTTCLRCHRGWTEEQARYAIESVKAHIKGKMRKAEFWLAALIDKIVEARKAGVNKDIIKNAQDQHLKAHILWEFWTAENSDGFHNPEMAKLSLTKSIDEAQKGIAMLDKAMNP
jgi:nitrite reductase (cytochrome c-552)